MKLVNMSIIDYLIDIHLITSGLVLLYADIQIWKA